MIRTNIILFIYLLFLAACTPPLVHNKSHFRLKDNSSNRKFEQLLTAGYYYSVYDREAQKGKRGAGINMKILLNNGYVHNFKNGYTNQCGDSVKLACEFRISERLLDDYLQSKNTVRNSNPINLWDWGRYDLVDGKILIQSFYNYFGDYYLMEQEGTILDNKSFRIFREKDYRTGENREKQETYIFKFYDIDLIYRKTPENRVFTQ